MLPLGGVTPPNTPTFAETGLPVDAFNPFNPFGQIISGGSRARLAEFGNRKIDSDVDAFLSTLGFKGDKLFDGSWGYDAGFRYSQVKDTENGTFVSVNRFKRILNAADPIFDPASADFIGTTIPFDPFGDFRVPIPTNQASVDFATIHTKDVQLSKLATLDLNIYTTQLFKLPAGGVGFAFGGQFRRENIVQNPDEEAVTGDVIGFSKEAITHAGRKDYAFYAETDVPVFSPENSVPGFHCLEFTAAARFEAFRNNDTNVLVPKFGLRWQPFRRRAYDSIHMGRRISRAVTLRALLFTYHGIASDTILWAWSDPETTTITSSNPNLQPEDSRALVPGSFIHPSMFQD